MTRRVNSQDPTDKRSIYYLGDDVKRLAHERQRCEGMLDLYEHEGQIERLIGAQKMLDLLSRPMDDIMDNEAVELSKHMVASRNWTELGNGPFYTLKITTGYE